eukprot:TRINITY_DN21609_c0_g1_i3.p1 TRINITY_DN21609_c0_g1~~TRINITY_DN21609_c0_g1_i3.p1  ORF type:complete len:483 (+),score=59.74 TRINITY_DN21609_c0_g1_i3:169-1449(+)
MTADGVEKSSGMYVIQAVNTEWHVHGQASSWLGFSGGIGQAIGATVFSRLADAYGRRFAFLAAMAVTLVSGALLSVAPNYSTLVAIRVVTNAGVGGALPVAFTLLSEVLPVSHRARWLPVLYTAYGLGRLVTACLAWALMEYSWRLFMIVLALPSAVVLCFAGAVPETPHYLLAQGHDSRAEEAINAIAVMNGKTSPLTPGITLRHEVPVATGTQSVVTWTAVVLAIMWLLLGLGNEWVSWVLVILLKRGMEANTTYFGSIILNATELVVPFLLVFCFQSTLQTFPRCLLSVTSILSASLLVAFAAMLFQVDASDHESAIGLLALAIMAVYLSTAGWVILYTVTPGYFPVTFRASGFGNCMLMNRVGYIVGPLLAGAVVDQRPIVLLLFCSGAILSLGMLAPSLPAASKLESEEDSETTRLVRGSH